jgi:hypothetical protein
MFYKVLKDEKVIDVLDYLSFIRYDSDRKRFVLCGNRTAQGIISSDEKVIWHVRGYHPLTQPGYDTVDIYEIDEKEYYQLKALGGKTPEEIIDNYTLYLIEEGLL